MTIETVHETGRWIVRPREDAHATLRLFCFPSAGLGTAAFRGWQDELPDRVEVCLARLPGRDGRFKEPLYTSLISLAAATADAMVPLLDRPFAIYGHSMGAWLGFEIARQLRRTLRKEPVHLFVAARRAPHAPARRPPLSALSDPEFIAEVRRRYDAIPQFIVDNPDLLQLMLPSLRADMAMLEEYTCAAEESLECPITVFGGSEDEETTAAELEAWRLHTKGPFVVRMLQGGHFFPNRARSVLLSWIARHLPDSSPEAGPERT